MGADLGVDQPWAVDVMAPVGWPSSPAELATATEWCRMRASARPWGVTCPRAGAPLLGRQGLVQRDALPVLALPAPTALRLDRSLPGGLRVDASPSRAAVVAAYGGWMQDHRLADALVRAGDLAQPARRFVVVSDGEDPAGCALVWLVAGTVALSGLGVLPAWRGRGVGAALVAAAAGLGLEADPGAAFVWMHATEQGARLYRRLGFEQVDEHVTLGAAA